MASNLLIYINLRRFIFTLISSDIVSVPGESSSAEGLSGRRYGDRMSQPLKRSGERVPGSRYHYRCIGTTQFRKGGMVKEGAVVIDVGTTRVPDASKKSGFKLTGDVKFDEVSPKCSFITPVPGGVGPMTIVSLMKNTLLAGRRRSINNPLLRFPLHRRGNGEFAFQYLSIMNT